MYGFSRVVLVGHSSGSVLAAVEASSYQDVSGLVLTGVSHELGTGTETLIAATIPVEEDPVLSRLNYPPDYYTLRAGSLGSLFYLVMRTCCSATMARHPGSRMSLPTILTRLLSRWCRSRQRAIHLLLPRQPLTPMQLSSIGCNTILIGRTEYEPYRR